MTPFPLADTNTDSSRFLNKLSIQSPFSGVTRDEPCRTGIFATCATILETEFLDFEERFDPPNTGHSATYAQKLALSAHLLATSNLQMLLEPHYIPYQNVDPALARALGQAMIDKVKQQARTLISFGRRWLEKQYDPFLDNLVPELNKLSRANRRLSDAGIRHLAQQLCAAPGFPIYAAEQIALCWAAAVEATEFVNLKRMAATESEALLLKTLSVLATSHFAHDAMPADGYGEEGIDPNAPDRIDHDFSTEFAGCLQAALNEYAITAESAIYRSALFEMTKRLSIWCEGAMPDTAQNALHGGRKRPAEHAPAEAPERKRQRET